MAALRILAEVVLSRAMLTILTGQYRLLSIYNTCLHGASEAQSQTTPELLKVVIPGRYPKVVQCETQSVEVSLRLIIHKVLGFFHSQTAEKLKGATMKNETERHPESL